MRPADALAGGTVAGAKRALAPAIAGRASTKAQPIRIDDIGQDAVLVAGRLEGRDGQRHGEGPRVEYGARAVLLCHPAFPI